MSTFDRTAELTETAGVVRAIAARDPRLRLESAPPLPDGWCGKQHACFALSKLARHPALTFLDADVRLSPDGSKIAADLGESNTDIWVYDVVRGASTRFTFGPSSSASPVWSRDGKWIAYAVLERAHLNIYRKSSSGMGQTELLLEGSDKSIQNWPSDLSPDGKSLLYAVGDLVGASQLWELPLTGTDRKPRAILPSSFVMLEGRYSPDGRWIAYASNESGKFEVYVIHTFDRKRR